MDDGKKLEECREEIITFYQGEGARFEQQAVETFRLAGQCRSWADSVRYLPPAGVEYVHGIVTKAKEEQAEKLAGEAFTNAMAEACRPQ